MVVLRDFCSFCRIIEKVAEVLGALELDNTYLINVVINPIKNNPNSKKEKIFLYIFTLFVHLIYSVPDGQDHCFRLPSLRIWNSLCSVMLKFAATG